MNHTTAEYEEIVKDLSAIIAWYTKHVDHLEEDCLNLEDENIKLADGYLDIGARLDRLVKDISFIMNFGDMSPQTRNAMESLLAKNGLTS